MAASVDRNQVKRAVDALLTHSNNVKAAKAKESSTKDLLEEEDVISLVIAWKKLPKLKAQPKKHKFGPLLKPLAIPLPHTLNANAEICLFTKDTQKEWKEKIAKAAAPNIEKVVGFRKLRKNYKTYEAKRKLALSYHLFMADDSILPMLSKYLGKEFFSRKKIPIAVNLKRNIANEIARARDSTYIYLTGSCSNVKVGLSSFTAEQILTNAMKVLDALANMGGEKKKKYWANVQSVNIKTSDSIALPLYHSLPQLRDPAAVAQKKAEKAATKAQAAREAELDLEKLIAEADILDSEGEDDGIDLGDDFKFEEELERERRLKAEQKRQRRAEAPVPTRGPTTAPVNKKKKKQQKNQTTTPAESKKRKSVDGAATSPASAPETKQNAQKKKKKTTTNDTATTSTVASPSKKADTNDASSTPVKGKRKSKTTGQSSPVAGTGVPSSRQAKTADVKPQRAPKKKTAARTQQGQEPAKKKKNDGRKAATA